MKPNEIVAPLTRCFASPASPGDEARFPAQQPAVASVPVASLQAVAAPPKSYAWLSRLLPAPRAPRPLPPSARRPFIRVSDTLVRGRRPYIHELDRLKSEFGVKTIINMDDPISAWMWPWDPQRPSPEALQQAAQERGMTMHLLPISCVAKPTLDQIQRILDIMDDPEAQPVYLHCFKGFERTNFVVAMHRIFRERVDVREAYRDMLSMGFRRPLVLKLLATFFDWTRPAAVTGATVGSAGPVSEKGVLASMVGAALSSPRQLAAAVSPEMMAMVDAEVGEAGGGSHPEKAPRNLAA